MENLAGEKAHARKLAFVRRKSAHSAVASQRGAKILTGFLSDRLGQPMSGYMPIRTEIDPLRAMTELARHGPVGVPVILGAGQPLEFRRWTPETRMDTGPFGALIPADTKIVVPKVLIVPLAAFDNRGHRLGYGGGYYDRTLEILRAQGDVLAVGFAYEAQQTDVLPTETTDQPLDLIVTDAGVRRFTA